MLRRFLLIQTATAAFAAGCHTSVAAQEVPAAQSQPQSDPQATDAQQPTAGPIGGPSAQIADQASDPGLADIVVTAQKRSENIQRVPIAITAVTPDKLTAANVNSFLDLGNAVPGLTLLNVGGQITPRIRGVGSTTLAPGIEPPVAVIVDGVYFASSSDVGGDLADTAQVAVLKGPQGTLFGRNATGGVVQVSTRDPESSFSGDITTSLDNYLTSRTSVYLGGGVAEDVKIGLSAQYVTQGEGWGTNIFNGQDVHKIDNNVTLRAKIIVEPSSRMTVRLSGDFASREGSTAGAFNIFPGFVQAYISPVPRRAWDVNSYIQPRQTYSGGGVSLTAEQDVGFARLTSITAFRRSKQFWRFSPGGTSVPSLDLEINDFSRQFTQELQLVSKETSDFTWAVGAFYIHTNAGQDPQTINLRAGPYRGAGPFSNIITETDQKLDSLAGFAQATYNITGSTRLTGGLRYTYEKKTLSGTQRAVPVANPAGFVVLRPQATLPAITARKPTWRISIDQDLSDRVIGYISYNRGFKSGGFNVRDLSNPPFNPEQIDAFEAGIKSQLLDNRLRLNVSGFYYDYKNVQVSRYTTTSVIYNGARAEIYGLDLDADAKVSDALQVNGSVSLLHARFTDFPNAVYSRYAPSPVGNTITLFAAPANGNRLPFSPSLTYTLGINYFIPITTGRLAVNFNDSYSSSFALEPNNQLIQKSYHYLNSSLAWTSPDTKYGVRLFVNNILDKAVPSNAGSLVTGYQADYPSPPRTYGARLQVSF